VPTTRHSLGSHRACHTSITMLLFTAAGTTDALVASVKNQSETLVHKKV
jgi:hypothetical protein